MTRKNMANSHTGIYLPEKGQHKYSKARSLPAATITAGLSLLCISPLHAQSIEQLKSDNSRLEAENARLKQALQSQKTEQKSESATSTNTASSSTTASSASASTAEVEQTASASGDAELLAAVRVQGKRIQEIPKSISVITGEELEKFHVYNFRDIVNRIGNVRTSWQNPNTASIFVRGVGWAAGAGVLDPSVGVTVDGVSHGIASITALSNFNDVETVDVARGPAGVEGGKSANVGRVTITTKQASFASEAKASLTIGELNSITGTATLGGALIDNLLAYRLSISRETADGPFDNKNDTHYTWRNTDRTNVRTQFLLTPTDNVAARLTLDITPTGREICENCFAFRLLTPDHYDRIDPTTGLPKAVDYAEDNLGKISRRWFAQKADYTVSDYYAQRIDTVAEYPNTYATKGATADIKWDLNRDTTLQSITGYRDYKFSQGAGTHTQFEWLRAPRGTQTQFNQFSQELKLDYKVSESLKYQGGLYYYAGVFPNTSQTERYGSDGGAWYANAAQYKLLDPVNLALPNATDSAGRALLLNSLDGLITKVSNQLHNKSTAAYSNVVWNPIKDLALSAGVRFTKETRKTSGDSIIQSNGFGAELNPASVNNVQLNGFANGANGVLTPGANNAAQLALADFVAQKYFGVATYGALTPTQLAQVAAAKAIRAGRIGSLYQQTDAASYDKTLPVINVGANYRLTSDHNVFVSWKHGEKAGVSQIVGGTKFGGKSVPVDTEKTDAYEIGTKSHFLDRTLSVDATLFLQNVKNYIQPIFVFDEVQTQINNNGNAAYLSALGNVPKVQTKGLELDLVYSGIPYTTLRASGAYTDAKYKDFKFAANPGELGGDATQPYYDATGKTLAGAPKYSGNVFGDFSYPVLNDKVVHANVNYNYQSSYYADPTLSRYSLTRPYGLTDLSLGIGRQDRRFDVAVIVKNVFNVDTSLLPTWNSLKPGIPRWYGVTVNAQF